MIGSRAFLLGYPVAHSISPPIHNAAFRTAGIEADYCAREVAPADLAAAVDELRADASLGANITVPHKQAVLRLVDALDDPARVIGAANTLYRRGAELRATNTDADGFARSLECVGFDPRGAAALLLGAGGSARAVGFALLRRGLQALTIANRTAERAEALAADLRRLFPSAAVRAMALSTLDGAALNDRRLVVNTTTVGLHGEETPLPANLLPAGATVVDIIYNPPRTRLLREAEQLGLPTLNGLPMLVHQAALAWEIWTGRPSPLEAMFAAAESALAARERERVGR